MCRPYENGLFRVSPQEKMGYQVATRMGPGGRAKDAQPQAFPSGQVPGCALESEPPGKGSRELSVQGSGPPSPGFGQENAGKGKEPYQ